MPFVSGYSTYYTDRTKIPEVQITPINIQSHDINVIIIMFSHVYIGGGGGGGAEGGERRVKRGTVQGGGVPIK